MCTSATRSRRAAHAVAASCVAGLVMVGSPAPASADSQTRTLYGAPSVRCTITDPKLAQTSGMAAANGRLHVVSDAGEPTLFELDSACAIKTAITLQIGPPVDPAAQTAVSTPATRAPGRREARSRPSAVVAKTTDVEDVAAGPDGSLYLADIGGNTTRRVVVSLYRWPGVGTAAARYDLRYPDGPHDAEALLVSLSGQAVIVTKAGNGRSAVYAAPQPMTPSGVLTKVADLNVATVRAPTDTAPPSALVTGGAVAPDGVHFALRTYTAAYEWDAPDGDIIHAFRTARPRVVPLARDRQGEAIGYSADGRRLMTTGEQLPSPVRELTITRGQQQTSRTAPRTDVATWIGAAVALLLGAAVLALGRERRRWARRATTYESG